MAIALTLPAELVTDLRARTNGKATSAEIERALRDWLRKGRRPKPDEIRGAIAEATIKDDEVTWREALQWVIGERTHLVMNED